jgi:hypothetical protein
LAVRSSENCCKIKSVRQSTRKMDLKNFLENYKKHPPLRQGMLMNYIFKAV